MAELQHTQTRPEFTWLFLASGRGYQRKSPRIDGRQINVYVIQYQQEGAEE